MKRIASLVIIPGLIVLVMASCAGQVPRHDGPVTDHFDGRQFHDQPPVEKSMAEVLKWQFTRQSEGPWQRDIDPPRVDAPPARVPGGALQVTFVNHATVLIQGSGVNLLTDPIWSERASPFQNVGPRRYRQPGLAFRDLPPIDVVLLSHNHFDHMDSSTIEDLARGHDPLFVAPLGNCFYLEQFGAGRCREMDWWDSFVFDDRVTIHAVPVRHWSRRGLLDTNRALWAGYFFHIGGRDVFFAGDTGMGDHFSQVRARLGEPDLALLPIGAYLPRWFMGAQHMDPGAAVEAHRLLGATESMAIHFGTFRLADDGQEQPIQDLRAAVEREGMPLTAFWIPDNGDSRRWPVGEPP